MRQTISLVLFLAAACLLSSCSMGNSSGDKSTIVEEDLLQPQERTKKKKQKISKSGIPFIKNTGQLDPEIKFYATTSSGSFFVTRNSLTYSFEKVKKTTINGLPPAREKNPPKKQALAVKERFLGGVHSFTPMGKELNEIRINYFVGNRENRQTNFSSYNSVYLGAIWPNIEVSLKAYKKNIQKLFTVNPGGQVTDIELGIEGISGLDIASDGALVLKARLGEVRMRAPRAFQQIDGEQMDVQIACGVDGTSYGFQIGAYDSDYPLVISLSTP